jgi:hypothetical protein
MFNRKRRFRMIAGAAVVVSAVAAPGRSQFKPGAPMVRVGISGVLSPLATPVQVGQHVTAGTSVAMVIQVVKLKAALLIAETRARDIQIGQYAFSDTHSGIIPGHVTRIDPSVVNGTRIVDVELDGPLPPGAIPSLSVDRTIDLARLTSLLYVGRLALGNENSKLILFKIDPDGRTLCVFRSRWDAPRSTASRCLKA